MEAARVRGRVSKRVTRVWLLDLGFQFKVLIGLGLGWVRVLDWVWFGVFRIGFGL